MSISAPAGEVVAVRDLVADLQKAIGAAQVRFDHMSRLLYSTDASNYQVMPIGVTIPRDADDVAAIHEIASRHQTPLLPRGGGSALAGQTVGRAIIMDMSRHMRRVRGVNAEARTVQVESGLALGQMNKQTAGFDLMFGPDPASAQRATVGGCIGNNATGAHSILYGMTADNIRRLEVVLASGERLWLDAESEKMKAIRARIGALVTQHQAQIEARFPKTFRTVAGYALNKIDPDNVNLNWLLAGSEGTLATIIQAELALVDRPKAHQKRLALVHFDTIRAALEATPRILETNPSAIELLDRQLMDKTRQNAEFKKRLTFVDGDPAALLITEYYGADGKELDAHLQNLRDLLARIDHTSSVTYAESPEDQSNVWEVRKAGLGLLMSERGDAKPIPFIEDAAVPVEHLADYIQDVEDIVTREGTTCAIYAHASAGCLHVRPMINLKTHEGRAQYRNIGGAVAQTAIKYNGTITGEHGKGQSRGEFENALFGETLTEAFREVKGLFDPDNLMNPGKIIDPPRMDDPANLRYTPDYKVIELKTRYDWSADNGFSGAAEMCNGAGVCRKEGEGTMCPSFMATLDESHATRGRANALRLAMSGHVPGDLGSDAVAAVFDLCLSCKACKVECPSAVDVARLKAEFLAARYDRKGVPLTARIFGNVHRLNEWMSRAPRLSNFMMRNPLGKLGARIIGLPTKRPLPLLAKQRFSAHSRSQHDAPDATLVIDTFTEFNHPEIGAALLKITDALGLKINVARLTDQGCCGRPAISKGLLDQAKMMAAANVEFLATLDGPILWLEPSCLSALTDDYIELVPADRREAAMLAAEHSMSVEGWLADRIEGASLTWAETPQKIMLHGHCHQKALWGTGDTLRLLRAIPGAEVAEIDSGCCGVAGSYGYEHYDISMKIGEQRLLPAIADNPDTLIAAPGTSCRAQIDDAGYTALHPVQIVADALG